jgi:hypothetical protein
MKSILLSALAFAAMSTVALAGPVPLTDAQMDTVAAGQSPPGLSTTQVNGGGNTPSGNANGVPTTTTNNGGNAPPGHN